MRNTKAVATIIQAVSALSTVAARALLAKPMDPSKTISAESFFIGDPSLDCVCIGLAGADAHGLFQIEDENLAIADLPGVRGFLDRFDHGLEHRIRDRRLELY